MGCFYEKINNCIECCCYIYCMGGVLYHLYEEGNLNCGVVKESPEVYTTIVIDDEIY